MKLRTGKTVRGGREPPLGERRTGASFLPFAEKRKRSQPQTFFTLQYFFTKPRGNAAGLCTPQRRLFKRKPPCGKRRRPICGALHPTLPRTRYGRRTRQKAAMREVPTADLRRIVPHVAACMVRKAHARQGETATSRQLRTTGVHDRARRQLREGSIRRKP